MDTTDARLRADHIDLELDPPPAYKAGETQKLKLYNVATLPQKITNWLFVCVSLGSIVSNFLNIATTIGIASFTNSTTPCHK